MSCGMVGAGLLPACVVVDALSCDRRVDHCPVISVDHASAFHMLTLSLTQLALLGTGAALGGLVFGLMGFAYGVVVSLFIHHGFAAADVVFIVVGGALALNVGLLPRFRRELRWRSAVPSLIGAALGLPLGLWLLARLDVGTIRVVVALVIIGYGVFALRRHGLAPLRVEPARLRVVAGPVGLARVV